MLVGKFFRACAAAAGVAIAACAAQAADLPGYYGGCNGGCGAAYIPPPFFWQGGYVGGFGGVAWSSIQAADNLIILTNSGVVQVGPLSSTGVMGGAQLGYNIQYGRFVYGIEADLGGLDDGASLGFTNRALASLLQINSSGGFFGDVTGRAGWIGWSTLFYARPASHFSRAMSVCRLPTAARLRTAARSRAGPLALALSTRWRRTGRSRPSISISIWQPTIPAAAQLQLAR